MLEFWNVDGNKISEQEVHNDQGLNLLADGSLSSGRAFDSARVSKSIEQATGNKPDTLYLLSSAVDCNVLDAVLSDGTLYRVKLYDDSLGAHAGKRQATRRISRECAMMDWMSAFSNAPVPKVLMREVSTSTPHMITEHPGGSCMYGQFTGLLNEHKRRNLQSYADISLSMFHVQCPSYIGSIVSCCTEDDIAQLGPCIHPFDGERAPSVYDKIEDYFGWLLHKKRTLMSDAARRAKEDADADAKPPARTRQAIPRPDPEFARIRRAFSRLEVHLAEAIRDLDEPLLRCVPVLEDLSPRNVWMDAEGRITGIVDWSAHIVKPAVLAAAYPTWLSYPDYNHPQLNARDGRYMESPEEAERLCVQFDNILLERDAEFYNALKEGVFLRMAETWLKDASSDLKQLQAVMSHAVVNMV